MDNAPSQPFLEVGQVWSFNDRDIAIIGLGRHLAEYRQCCDGKVARGGASEMKSIRTVRAELLGGRARLTGHLVIADTLLQLGGPRSATRK